MRVLVLTGNQGNQRALCHKIADVCEIASIVVSENIPRKPPSAGRRIRAFLQKIQNRIAGRPFVAAWLAMQSVYNKRYPDFPAVPLLAVRNVNDKPTLDAIATLKPDLIVVSGTNLVGRSLIAAAANTKGIVNLHTGISPYVKGGPNCTNWCLAKGWFHLIGSTVMWLDAGIDTGTIIATEQTPLDGAETLTELHLKVMDHAHDLYVRSIERIAAEVVPSVPQDEIAEGHLFYTADWNVMEMRAAKRNFDAAYKAHFVDRSIALEMKESIRLVSL